MPIEKPPGNPLPRDYAPSEPATTYKVQNGDDWYSVAKKFGFDAGAVIEFNFKTRLPAEVNWYLRRNVGCKKTTQDNLNWMFSSDADPGIIYIPKKVVPLTTIVHSVASLSWIDPRLYDAKSLPEVDRGGDPGEIMTRDRILGKTAYRFANFLEAYVVVNTKKEVEKYGFTSDSGMYMSPSYRGIEPEAFAEKTERFMLDNNRGVRFVQTVGCKTISPETIGGSTGMRTVAGALGIPRYYEGINEMTRAVSKLGYDVGRKVAEQILVFPPIWTQLELTIYSDGSFEGNLVRHSIFPSVSFYLQRYTVEAVTYNTTSYTELSTYDARTVIDKWRSAGWGILSASTPLQGPVAGNPWGIPDPRILGRDLPIHPDPPPYPVPY